ERCNKPAAVRSSSGDAVDEPSFLGSGPFFGSPLFAMSLGSPFGSGSSLSSLILVLCSANSFRTSVTSTNRLTRATPCIPLSVTPTGYPRLSNNGPPESPGFVGAVDVTILQATWNAVSPPPTVIFSGPTAETSPLLVRKTAETAPALPICHTVVPR